jgi:hypothetical protein
MPLGKAPGNPHHFKMARRQLNARKAFEETENECFPTPIQFFLAEH